MIPIIDLHTDLVLAHFDFGDKRLQKTLRRQITVQKLTNSNTRILFAGFGYDNHYGNAKKHLSVYKGILNDENFKIISSKKDLKTDSGRTGVILHIEGAGFIQQEKDLQEYYACGVRSIGLTHNYKNGLACGIGEDDNSGLTHKGKKIVKLANKLRMVLDLAHLNSQSFKEVASLYSGPLIVSHTACKEVRDLPRNISDAQMKEVAKSGGIIGIFLSGKFLTNKVKPTINDLVLHFQHVADTVGISHLAIGSDYGGITTGTPLGLSSVNTSSKLLLLLRKSGFSEDDVEKIAYKNALRVLKNIL